MTTVEGGGERGEAGVKGEIIKSKRTRTAFVPFFFFFFSSLSTRPPRGRYRCRFNPFPSGRWFTRLAFLHARVTETRITFHWSGTGSELLHDPRSIFPKKFEGTIFSIRNKRNPPPSSRFLSRENKRGVILIITFRIKTLIQDRRSNNWKIFL